MPLVAAVVVVVASVAVGLAVAVHAAGVGPTCPPALKND